MCSGERVLRARNIVFQLSIAASLVACHSSNDGDGGDASQGGGPPPGNPPTFTIGGLVTGLRGGGLVLENNAGDELAIAANGAFAFATTLPFGAGYSITVRTQPTANPAEACVVANGSGAVTSAVTNVAVSCHEATTGKYAYTLYNTSAGARISGFSIDPVTGALTELPGSPFPIVVDRFARALHRSGDALFVLHEFPRLEMAPLISLTGYAIDATTGALTVLSGTPISRLPYPSLFPYDSGPFFHPNGRVVYLLVASELQSVLDRPEQACARADTRLTLHVRREQPAHDGIQSRGY